MAFRQALNPLAFKRGYLDFLFWGCKASSVLMNFGFWENLMYPFFYRLMVLFKIKVPQSFLVFIQLVLDTPILLRGGGSASKD